jgi:hypothetical protein
MKVIKTPNGHIINVDYIVSVVSRTKTKSDEFDFTINLVDGSRFDVGSYPSEEQKNEELNKLKDFLIDDSSRFYYYVDNNIKC